MQSMLDNIESSEDDSDDDDNHDVFNSELEITQTRIPTWKALLFRVSEYMNVDATSIVPTT